jgi:hypothetical protein
MRLDDKRTPKRILEWKSIGTRIRGGPKKRWIVDIEKDMQIIGIRRLKPIVGCSANKRKRRRKIRVLQIGYMIATEICTIGPTVRAVSVKSYAFLSTYGYGFQSVILIFFNKYSNCTTGLCGGKMCLSSEVKSVDLM